MVLAETTGTESIYYLHGLDLVAQSDGVSTEYFGYDGLGNVRQVLDGAGEVLFAQVYDPYGNPFENAGTSSTGFGFTGEQEDGNGLVYLRARYYAPYLSQFIQRDRIVPNPYESEEWNPYTYARNNPILYIDPSGLTPIGSPIPMQNDRDLTWWLFKELSTNVDSYYVQRIRTLLDGSVKEKYNAINAWMWLVKDSAKWDFKHRIEFEMGRAFTFLDYQQDYRWYEYSVPGNIFYGYIGSAAGFSEFMLHGGASYAEIADPSHKERGESCCPSVCAGIYYGIGPFKGGISFYCQQLGCYYVNPDWAGTFFDDPTDFNAVQLGIDLYKSYQNNLTYLQLVDSLNFRGDSLAYPSSPPESFHWVNPLAGCPYDVGRFNGPDDSVNESTVLEYLK